MLEEEIRTLLGQFLQPDGEDHHAPRRRAQECLEFDIDLPKWFRN